MKLILNKERFLKAIQKAEKITSKNPTLPVLACVLIVPKEDSLEIKSTNLDIAFTTEIRCKVEEGGEAVAIPNGVISSFVSGLPKNDSELTLEEEDGNLHIISKTTDTTIKTQPTEDFPEIGDIDKEVSFKMLAEDFIEGLKSVWYSAAISSIKPELSSIYVYGKEDEVVFVATDSFRLAERRIKVKGAENIEEVLVPYKNVAEIIRIFDDASGELTFYFESDQLKIESDETKVISRVVNGNFPDYKQIIPKEETTKVDLLKEDLSQALKVTNIFAGKFNQVVFSIMPEDNILEVYSSDNDKGESRNRIKATADGESLKISFNNRYITDCFQSIDSDSLHISFNGLNKPMIIKGVRDAGFLYLVMPMNR